MNNERKLGLDSAFPVSDPNTALAMFNAGVDPTGMSKRFYAACMAMQGLLSNPNTAGQIRSSAGDVDAKTANAIVCRTAYEIAEELLKQEQL